MVEENKEEIMFISKWGVYAYNVMLFGLCNAPAIATPLWPSVGVKPNTSKVGDLESSGTPECLEFDRKAQNTSH